MPLGCRIIHASCVARQSATIVPDNRLALPPSLAVEYSRVFSLLVPCWRGAPTPSLLHTLFWPGPLEGVYKIDNLLITKSLL
ncbi:MAG: hypothetical protein ACI8W7_001943 [Gammaproteobacteria bacterium]|jgi:hypothetical protein